MKTRLPHPASALAAAALCVPVPQGQCAPPQNDWPGWRGPGGNGQLPVEAAYPKTWSLSDGIVWKVPLPAPGNSSPVVIGSRVFVTVAEDKGFRRSILCFDSQNGKEVWRQTVDYAEPEVTHPTNPWTPATPVTDGTAIYVWHGSAGLFAYNVQDGKPLWKRDLGRYQHQWGANAGSPVLFEGNLLLHAGPGDQVKLMALSRADGKTVWETPIADAVSTDIKEFKGSWATPVLRENAGETEMIVALPKRLAAYNAKTGQEIWRCAGLSDLCYTDPLVGQAHAVYMCGYGGPAMGMSLPGPGETGDVTARHQLWVEPRNQQRIGSGVIIGDFIYICNEPGAMECLELATGKSRWKERVGRNTWSSAVYAGGLIYVTDQAAVTHLIEPSPDGLKKVGENPVGPNEFTNATPAFARGSIYLRTNTALYRIGK